MQQEPRVFIEVMRTFDSGPPLVARVEVSAAMLGQAKHPCALLTVAFREALAAAGYRINDTGITIP